MLRVNGHRTCRSSPKGGGAVVKHVTQIQEVIQACESSLILHLKMCFFQQLQKKIMKMKWLVVSNPSCSVVFNKKLNRLNKRELRSHRDLCVVTNDCDHDYMWSRSAQAEETWNLWVNSDCPRIMIPLMRRLYRLEQLKETGQRFWIDVFKASSPSWRDSLLVLLQRWQMFVSSWRQMTLDTSQEPA